MTRSALSLVGLSVLICLATRASAEPIDITARLNPGQSGPVYAWSLTIRVDPGYEVGAVDLFTSGFDSVVFNAANPGIGILDSAYTTNTLGDGRNFLVLNNYANGVAISSPGEEVLLATFYGPNRTSPPVILWAYEEVDPYPGSATVYDPFLIGRPPGDTSLSAYPLAVVSLRVVPEPSHSELFALAALLLFAARGLERHAVGAAELEAAPLE